MNEPDDHPGMSPDMLRQLLELTEAQVRSVHEQMREQLARMRPGDLGYRKLQAINDAFTLLFLELDHINRGDPLDPDDAT